MRFSKGFFFLLFCLAGLVAQAQEYIAPLRENADLKAKAKAGTKTNTARKPTALTLPFFEDFTDDSPYPNTERWADPYVYINNTMGKNMISRGVATFDVLNEKGNLYYDTITAYTTIYADTLTSLAIDLSLHNPADSVYLSFFYEPKGYGFSPKPYDSLMLFLLKSNGVWEKVWSVNGDTLTPSFHQVMVPVKDTGYFNNNFKMRWINKATQGISNSHWNLDYIRMEEGRNRYDTAFKDFAFTKDPTSILNDFSAMPFRHFKTNPASFLAPNLNATIRPNDVITTVVSYPVNYTAKVVADGSALGSGSLTGVYPNNAESTVSYPMYNAGAYTPPNINSKVVYENLFYQNEIPLRSNDSIRFRQVFDNYFAYDDGTAEQSYFLNLLPNAPGATAVEYALYVPDTLRGIAIRFARQNPTQVNKEFAIAVYRDIAVNGGTDDLLYQENFLYPYYEDTINKFSVYVFEQPLLMNPGSFYISIIQAAGGTSDSLHIALDANRTGVNHRYFKVENTWEPSLLEGALLLRPLLGTALPLGISSRNKNELAWNMHPNPAEDKVHISIPALGFKSGGYKVIDLQGKTLLNGNLKQETDVDISSLLPGIYFLKLQTEAGYTQPLKLLKR